MRETVPLDSVEPTGAADQIPFPYDIAFVDTDGSPAVRAQVEEQLGRLSHFYDRITYARVNIRSPHKHGGARRYHIHVEIDLPGKLIAVSREPEISDKHCDIRVAVRDAFHKVVRQVEDFVKQRNEHKGHNRHFVAHA